MITIRAVVSVGRFLYGGFDPLYKHLSSGGRLPFNLLYNDPLYDQEWIDIEIFYLVKTLTLLEGYKYYD